MDDDITVSSLAQKVTDPRSLENLARQRGWSEAQLDYAMRERFGTVPAKVATSHDDVGFFQHFNDNNEREWGAKTSLKIAENVEETFARMSFKNQGISASDRSGYGLVVGRIQSGKTAHIIGLCMRAMDRTLNDPGEEYNTVIILSGLLEDLRKQTFSRVNDIGVDDIRILPQKSDFTEKNDEAKEELLDAFCQVDPCILVVKKNHIVIEAILDYLEEPEISLQLDERRILIIDDECDHASIDSSHAESDEDLNEGDITATNRAVRGLILSCLRSNPTQWYLGYTATPYSNLLMHPEPEYLKEEDLGPSLFPRDMIHCLPNPGGPKSRVHQDNQLFFKGDGRPYIQEFDIPPAGGGEERNHLREMLLMHVISKILRERGESVKHHTTMIHTDVNTPEHLRVGQIVQEIKDEEYDDITDQNVVPEILECAKKYYPDHVTYLKEECSRIKESSFLSFRQYFREATVVLLNADKEQEDSTYEFPSVLNYDSKKEVSIIVIGGHKLSRGLTLEGLTVTWFARTSQTPNYDTLLQMSRWCGFREDYLELIRIFMDSTTIEHYQFITEVERRLRNDLRSFTKETNPLDEVQWIKEYYGMCISGKLPDNLTQHPSSTKAISPEIVLEQLPENFSKKEVLETQSDTFDAFEDLMSFHSGEFEAGPAEFDIARTSYDQVEDFIRRYAASYEKKCDSKKYIDRLLIEISENESLSEDWNFVIHRPSSGRVISGFKVSRLGFRKGKDNHIKIPNITHRVDIPFGVTSREKPMLCIFLEDPEHSFAGIPVYNDNGIPIVIVGFFLPPESLSAAFIEMARPGVLIPAGDE